MPSFYAVAIALGAIHEEEMRPGRGERRARAAEEVQLPQHVGATGSREWLNFGAASWFDLHTAQNRLCEEERRAANKAESKARNVDENEDSP